MVIFHSKSYKEGNPTCQMFALDFLFLLKTMMHILIQISFF